MKNLDWESDQTQVLVNHRLPAADQQQFTRVLLEEVSLKGHIWVATSGSSADTKGIKWVALAKEAILASAQAVNSHLLSTHLDIWISPLPDFHVGGLGIWARSFLSGASVVDFKAYQDKWCPCEFHRKANESQATLTALVPTQVYDLVMQRLPAPKSLRAAIIGGGALHPALYAQAVELGWRLLPSYGLTECSSQVATAQLDSWSQSGFPELHILPHLQVSIDDDGLICLKGPSILTGYAFTRGGKVVFLDPKKAGWFQTEDRGCLHGSALEVWGRRSSFVKVGGESVNVRHLEMILEEAKLELSLSADVVLLALPDERLGHAIHLATNTHSNDIQTLIRVYETKVMPFEKIRHVHYLKYIPRTPLNKVCMPELIELLKMNRDYG